MARRKLRPWWRDAKYVPLAFVVVCLLGVAWSLASLFQMRQVAALECEAQRAHNWQTMPEQMAQFQAEADARRALVQTALAARRQASWWAWLVLPAHPPEPGCQTTPF